MNEDIYFSLLIKGADGAQTGVTLCIPADNETLPGHWIKALIAAARRLPLDDGEKLRTEMQVAPSTGIDTRPIADYLWGDGTLNAERLIRHLNDYKEHRVPHDFQPHVGMTVVMEEEFIGRKPVLDLLENYLKNNTSCHLRAPRRYGKSSLMGRLTAKLANAVMLELSDVATLQGFLKALLRACMRHQIAGACLVKQAAYRSWPHVTDSASFSQVFNQAFSDLTNAYSDKKLLDSLSETLSALADEGIILLVDEFSIFLREMHDKNPNDLATFLGLFHRLRRRDTQALVAVFAGSAGLSTFIELYDMHDLFADLAAVDVPPVTGDEARLLAEELFYGMKKRPTLAAINRLVELTGNDDTVPYFVQALASYSAEQTGRRREIQADDVERAYYDRLLGPAGNTCFRDFILRERAYPGEYRSCASPILKRLSRAAPELVTEDELQQLCTDGCDFKKIMTCLEEDYDLVYSEKGWRMRSRVIADRWRLGEPWLTMGNK